MKQILFYLTVFFIFFFSLTRTEAQQKSEVFTIDSIEASEEHRGLIFFVTALNKEGAFEMMLPKFGLRNFGWQRRYARIRDLLGSKTSDQTGKPGVLIPQKNLTVLFLLDLSGSMRNIHDNKLKKAQDAIRSTLSIEALKTAKVNFAWFHDAIGEQAAKGR
ncbi:MAG: hypothetical protein IPM82_07415 [Saprospiraceae bacterium]|nr:hypothetical protein [Saprospiraceae bacterium]